MLKAMKTDQVGETSMKQLLSQEKLYQTITEMMKMTILQVQEYALIVVKN